MSVNKTIDAISKGMLKYIITKLDPSQNVDGLTLSQQLDLCNSLLNNRHNYGMIDHKERYILVEVCRADDNRLINYDVDNIMLSCVSDSIPADAVRVKQIRYKKLPALQVSWATEDKRGVTKAEYVCDSLFRESTTIVPKNSDRDPKEVYSKIRKTGAGYSQEASAYLVGRSKSWGSAQDSERRET